MCYLPLDIFISALSMCTKPSVVSSKLSVLS